MVRRFLPRRRRSTVGAWCFLDHYGPDDVAGKPGMVVPPHPHIGLQTVSWLFAGEVHHRDSLGNHQIIEPGALNLMTAGSGIAHAELSPADHSAVLHGVQLWIALPRSHQRIAPSFQHIDTLPSASLGPARAVVLVGSLRGQRSPAEVFTPLVAAEIGWEYPGVVQVPLDGEYEHAVVGVRGAAWTEGRPCRPGDAWYLGPGRGSVQLQGGADAKVLLVGGRPFTEELVMWWNFVATSPEAIEMARADWEAGRRFGEVAGGGQRLAAPPLPAGRLKARGAG